MLLGIEVDEPVVLHGEELVVVVGRDVVVWLDERGLIAHGHLVISNLVERTVLPTCSYTW